MATRNNKNLNRINKQVPWLRYWGQSVCNRSCIFLFEVILEHERKDNSPDFTRGRHDKIHVFCSSERCFDLQVLIKEESNCGISFNSFKQSAKTVQSLVNEKTVFSMSYREKKINTCKKKRIYPKKTDYKMGKNIAYSMKVQKSYQTWNRSIMKSSTHPGSEHINTSFFC